MNKSQPILPIRFYDDLYDQQRFMKHCSECEDCQLRLVYPANEKPHFQFTRNSKLELPTMFYMRNTCTDKAYNNYKVLDESASHFGTVEATDAFGAFPKKGFFDTGSEMIEYDAINISCGNLIPVAFPDPSYILDSAVISFAVSDNQLYQFKLIVDKMFISPGSAFVIKIYIGGILGTLIAAITTPGVYIYDIFTGGDFDITVSIEDMEADDDFSISYIQATMMLFDTNVTGDVILDPTKLKVFPMTDGKDIIVYCGDYISNNVITPNAQYYYVVVSGSDYYVSEVFSIVTIKELEQHYKLTWWNVCDINKTHSIIYKQSTLDCNFRNILYLDAGLFKPEYDTVEEGEENGQGDISVRLQTWRKNLNFEVAKSPEFLTDALSGIFLHDNVYIKKPLNNYQEVLNNEYKVLKIVNNVSNVLDDCFQTVNLKMLLETKYVDTGCCTEANVFDCTPCKYISTPDCSSGYTLVITGGGVHGLFDCTGNLVSPPPRPTDLICHNGKFYTIELIASVWTVTNILPMISNVTLIFIFFSVDAYVIPFSFGQIEYNKNGAGWVYLDTVQGDATGYFNYYLPLFIPFGATDLKLRIHNVTLNCDFGYSDEYDVI